MIVLRRLALGLTCLLIAVLSDGPVDEGEKTTESGDTQTPDWVGPMRKVHARFSRISWDLGTLTMGTVRCPAAARTSRR